jgi:hypothetical protein
MKPLETDLISSIRCTLGWTDSEKVTLLPLEGMVVDSPYSDWFSF